MPKPHKPASQENKAAAPVREAWFNMPKQQYVEVTAKFILQALSGVEKARFALEAATLWAGSSELPMGDFWVQENMASTDIHTAAKQLNAALGILLGMMERPSEFVAAQPETKNGEGDGSATAVMARLRQNERKLLPEAGLGTR